ncbi:polysaccharide deacetylase family protein [Kitasatospora sp. NPDC127111]|uniref:polysaccharide deacetylase family protein n=1 Tax=Kitasatospora sp. NPDC127111 TaxID=3345363 RepID=UPI00363D8448
MSTTPGPGRRPGARGPLVLMYHGIGSRPAERDPYNLFVPPEGLERQLTTLVERGWTPLTLDRYLNGDVPRRSVLVTFDDGYRSMLDEGLPLLRRLRVPATVFVLPGLLDGTSRWMARMPDEPLLDAAGVRELARAGLDVECHGWDHSDLVRTDPEGLDRNVAGAAEALADLLGRRPRAYAYPYGTHDARARRAVAAAGFQVAFSVHEGDGRYAVPRVDVNSTDTGATFRLKTSRAYPALRRVSGAVPKLRPALHAVLGSARRS